MKTIILAAGRGSRLGERTKDRPKCMCRLGGKTLLERCLASLWEAGVSAKEIGIVTGYRREMIAVPQAVFFHNEQWERTNMVYSLMQADRWLSREDCLVCYSDIVFSTETVRILAECRAPLSLTYYLGFWELWRARMEDPLEDLETFRADKEGRLLEIGNRPKSREEVEGQYMGLLHFTPESWEWVKEAAGSLPKERAKRLDMTSLLQKILEMGHEIKALPVSDLWLECDTQEDVEVYERLHYLEGLK